MNCPYCNNYHDYCECVKMHEDTDMVKLARQNSELINELNRVKNSLNNLIEYVHAKREYDTAKTLLDSEAFDFCSGRLYHVEMAIRRMSNT